MGKLRHRAVPYLVAFEYLRLATLSLGLLTWTCGLCERMCIHACVRVRACVCVCVCGQPGR